MNSNADTARAFQQLSERLAALERHVFEQDKEMLAMSRQLEQLRGGLVGLRERLSEPSSAPCGSAGGDQWASAGGGERDIGGGDVLHAYAAERPPHY